MELLINLLHVVERDGLPEQHLVDWHHERTLDVVRVLHRQPEHPTDKVEVRQVLRVDVRLRADLQEVPGRDEAQTSAPQ